MLFFSRPGEKEGEVVDVHQDCQILEKFFPTLVFRPFMAYLVSPVRHVGWLMVGNRLSNE